MIPSFYFGMHHQYIGIKLNPRKDCKIFAARDIVLSAVFSSSRILSSSDISFPPMCELTIDLMCDVGNWKDTTNHEGVLYSIIKGGIPDLRYRYIDVTDATLDNLFDDNEEFFASINIDKAGFETYKKAWNDVRGCEDSRGVQSYSNRHLYLISVHARAAFS